MIQLNICPSKLTISYKTPHNSAQPPLKKRRLCAKR
jgi:hypothetical protein